jgi:hypothetical protein
MDVRIIWVLADTNNMTQSFETEIPHLFDAGAIEPEASDSPSLWRSLGGRLDYESWPQRQRFIELDRAIAATANWEREDAELYGVAESVDEESLFDCDAVCVPDDGANHFVSCPAAA